MTEAIATGLTAGAITLFGVVIFILLLNRIDRATSDLRSEISEQGRRIIVLEREQVRLENANRILSDALKQQSRNHEFEAD